MTDATDTSSRTFLRLLLAVVGTLSVLLVLPFLQAVLLAGLLAYLVAPINALLARRLGATLGAFVTMLATVVAVLAPLMVLVGVAVEQAVRLAQDAELPDVAALEAFFREWLGTNGASLSALADPFARAIEVAVGGLVGGLVGIVGGIPAFLVGVVIFLF